MEQLVNNTIGTKLTKKEFLKHPNLKSIKINIMFSAIVLYVCAAITLIGMITSGSLLSIIDVALVLGFALGVHLVQSRVCAILVLAYSLFNVFIVYLTTGSFGGWLILVGAIDAVIYTFKFQKAWKAYQEDGTIPETK